MLDRMSGNGAVNNIMLKCHCPNNYQFKRYVFESSVTNISVFGRNTAKKILLRWYTMCDYCKMVP